MLKSPHNNTIEAVLRNLQTLVGSEALCIQQSADNVVVKSPFIRESVDIFSSMRVNMLKRSSELIIQSLDI